MVDRASPLPPVLLMLLAAPILMAQDGAAVFRQTCAVGYCHGSGGTAGRAPALVDRGLSASHVMTVTRDGIANTGMPGWKDRLNSAELNAVVAYVVKLSGGGGTAAVETAEARAIPAAAQSGRELFFDPVRATRCSTCHAVEGKGLPIGPNLAAGPAAGVALIRAGKPAAVRQARLNGDAFPALLVEQKGDWVKVYDLTVPPPVLRTASKGALSWSSGSGWKHASATANYSDAELREVAEYLQWLASR